VRDILKILIAILILINISFTSLSYAEEDPVDKMVEKGKKFLLKSQREDGAFGSKYPVTMTSLATMSLLSCGHTPREDTPEGQALRKALKYVLEGGTEYKQLPDSLYFGQKDGSRMYGHGMTTLMLTQIAGMTEDEETEEKVRQSLERAVNLLLESQKQNKQGAWRYNPNSKDADVSVACWQIMAVRAAQNIGLPVPQESIDKAMSFLKKCFKNDGFGYSAGGGPRPSTTAEAMVSCLMCGYYEDELVKKAAEYMYKHAPQNYSYGWYFYTIFYYSQSAYQMGGKYDKQAQEVLFKVLSANQNEDGGWYAEKGNEKTAGPIYSTSIAIMALTVRYNYLPIFQK